jgi:uncharacterized protein
LPFILGREVNMEKISKPGEYSGYSQEIYSECVCNSQYIPGYTGTKLAADIYRPAVAGKADDRPWPAILIYTRYQRGARSEGTTLAEKFQFDKIVKHGYCIVMMDGRGTGASFGSVRDRNNPEEALDGKAVIEWLSSQPWCNGKVAMMGGSFLGMMQLFIASAQPKPLIAITPLSCHVDRYRSEYPNGVWKPYGNYASRTKDLDLNLPAQPVDEDAPPDYPLLQAARREHQSNIWADDTIFHSAMCRDSWSPALQTQPFWDSGVINYADRIKASGIKMYFMGGWFEISPPHLLAGYKLFGNKLLLGPWTHAQACGGGNGMLIIEHLRWFDYTLKGIENGLMNEPPICYYTINAPAGKEWRFAADWPLPQQKLTNYYFGPGRIGTVDSVNDGSLDTSLPVISQALDEYQVNNNVRVWDGNYNFGARVWDKDMTHCTDAQGLTYTSKILESDIEITGQPLTHLWIQSPVQDGTFFAFLEEVDTQGNSHFVTDGMLKASHRAVTPEYPWSEIGIPHHRSNQRDIIGLTNEPTELIFDLCAISYIFRKGNRIRLTITCSNKPTYAVPDCQISDPPPTIKIFRDANHPSCVTLPVLTKY